MGGCFGLVVFGWRVLCWLLFGLVRVVVSALVGSGGGRSWSTLLVWVGLFMFLWWGLVGGVGVGERFLWFF